MSATIGRSEGRATTLDTTTHKDLLPASVIAFPRQIARCDCRIITTTPLAALRASPRLPRHDQNRYTKPRLIQIQPKVYGTTGGIHHPPADRTFTYRHSVRQRPHTARRPKSTRQRTPYPLRLLAGRMQSTLHAARRTTHGALRLVKAISAWSVKTQRAPSRHSRDARV